MLRLIPSGPSIARESPRNLSAKCTPPHCATSDPKQLRDLQHRTSTASHPRRSYSHLFAFLTLIWHASTEIHFVRAVRCHHPARLPASRQPTCRAPIADSSLEASLLHSSLVQVPCASRVVSRKSPGSRAQKTRGPRRRSRDPLTNAAGRPESAVPEIGSSLYSTCEVVTCCRSEHLCVRLAAGRPGQRRSLYPGAGAPVKPGWRAALSR